MVDDTISHFRILDKLGEGGMGVVYKAQDQRLDRTVALKFLPTHSLPTDDDKARFYREAKAAAKLSHPHIAHVYEIDETDEGQAFIAMEYIEGETLAEKIRRGPLKLDEALTIAIEIAEGLQAAHEQGIVHRDVKSGNVMLTKKGRVKIMDFGLAKVEAASLMTKEGTTVGTIAYMSPEQARGEAVDHRSDIWSLGVVLYEMITGQLPFKGDYEQSIIYAILNQDPEPLTALRTGVPMALDGVIAKALAKDPGLRYQHVDEMPADLRALDVRSSTLATLSTTRHAAAPAQVPAGRAPLPWIVATAVMAVVAIVALWSPWREAPQVPLSHLALLSEPAEFFDGLFVVSPDGAHVVFSGRSEATGAVGQLFLRSLGEPQAVPLPETNYATAATFSPDGQWIAFVANNTLKKVSVSGGRPIPIAPVNGIDLSWGEGDLIVFNEGSAGENYYSRNMLISAQGGEPTPLPVATDDGSSLFTPHFLPGGRAILFTRHFANQGIDDASIVVQSLDTHERRTLIQGGTNPQYAPSGHLIYERQGTIMAAPFDLGSLAVTGPAVSVMEGEAFISTDYWDKNFSLSNTGTLLYRDRATEGGLLRRMVWVDRAGADQVVAAGPHEFWDPRLSPNGRRIAVLSRSGDVEAWVYEPNGALMRLTVNPGEDETPVWSPSGQWIAFASTRTDQTRALLRTPSDGSGTTELLWTSDNHTHVESWSRNEQVIIFTEIDPQTQEDIWVLHLGEEPDAQPLIKTAFREFGGKVSPDGRWLAYVSDESGRLEVYVQAYPNLGPKVPVSTDGGVQPVWGKGGRTLYYRGEESMMEVTLRPGEPFAIAAIASLFRDRYVRDGNHTGYDVAGDGERFLMVESEDAENAWTSLNVVLNWLDDVKQRVPTGK